MPFFKKKKEGPEQMETGWQFYARPTTLEPPGTVFRLDKVGKKFTVDHLKVKIEEGSEAEVSTVREIETTVGILARFFGLKSFDVKAGAGRVKRLKFSMTDPVRQVTTDYAVRDVIGPFLKEWQFLKDCRYFLIREARTASAMKYLLTKDLFADLGGEATINAAIQAGANIKAKIQDTVEIDQQFGDKMRVMFLAEEIQPIARFIGYGPEVVLGPVREVLIWEES